MHEVKLILLLGRTEVLLDLCKTLSSTQIKNLSNGKLKYILFEYYISINNIEAYQEVNIRFQYFLQKLNIAISEEVNTIWDKVFKKNRNFEIRTSNDLIL